MNTYVSQHAYLPAMPEDFAEDARRLLGGQYYSMYKMFEIIIIHSIIFVTYRVPKWTYLSDN